MTITCRPRCFLCELVLLRVRLLHFAVGFYTNHMRVLQFGAIDNAECPPPVAQQGLSCVGTSGSSLFDDNLLRLEQEIHSSSCFHRIGALSTSLLDERREEDPIREFSAPLKPRIEVAEVGSRSRFDASQLRGESPDLQLQGRTALCCRAGGAYDITVYRRTRSI